MKNIIANVYAILTLVISIPIMVLAGIFYCIPLLLWRPLEFKWTAWKYTSKMVDLVNSIASKFFDN